MESDAERIAWGKYGGWLGSAFLIGVFTHSVWSYTRFPVHVVTALLVFGIGYLVWRYSALVVCEDAWSARGRRRDFWLLVSLVCIGFGLGLWRFEQIISSLPRNLAPFSAKGLYRPKPFPRTANSVDPRYWLVRFREVENRRIHDSLPIDEANLLVGVLFGEREMRSEVREHMRRTGLLHIVAISGTNITYLTVVVMRTLLVCRCSRRWAFFLLSNILLAFVLFVQPTASVVRAAIMGWLVELAPLVGRLPRANRLLLIAAVTFTWWHPWALLYDASFALSFLAMAGLLTWSRALDERGKKLVVSRNLRELLTSTLGATLMTAPYLAWAFGQVTLLGLFTNFLVLPLIPFIMVLGVGAVLTNSALVFLPLHGLLSLILHVASWFSQVEYIYWKDLSTTFGEMVGWYVVIGVIYYLVKPKNRFIHKPNGLERDGAPENIVC